MENKTAIEWLEIARANGETWVGQAIENIAAQPDCISRLDSYPNIRSVVGHEFVWHHTPQRSKYWVNILNRLVKAGN